MSGRKRQKICQKNRGTNSFRNGFHHFNWRDFKTNSISFHKQMTKKEIFLEIATCFIVFTSLLGMYWYFIDGVWNPILTFKSSTIEVQPNTTVKAGDVLQFHWQYCKNRDISAVVSTKFIDTIQYNLKDYTSKRDVGCNDPDSVTGIYIPEVLPSGTYTLEQIFTYQINPIKTITYKIKSNEFIIDNTN